MLVKCLAVGTVLDKLYLVQDTDEMRTVLCYVSCPYGREVRKLLQDHARYLPGLYHIPGLTLRCVKDYRLSDQMKGIEVIRVGRVTGMREEVCS
jgi:hypothetical protein